MKFSATLTIFERSGYVTRVCHEGAILCEIWCFWLWNLALGNTKWHAEQQVFWSSWTCKHPLLLPLLCVQHLLIKTSTIDMNLLSCNFQAWKQWNGGLGSEFVASSLGDTCPNGDVLRYMLVGLLCVQGRPDERPSMPQVVIMLGSETANLPSPKEPITFSKHPWFKFN